MLRPSLIGLGKFLSYVLRHRPDAIGLSLDTSGWVDIEQLLQACQAHGKPLTRALLDTIVATDSKRRFAISDDGRRIRACQGHSIGVDLGYEPRTPPETLFHGTVARALPRIRVEGLRKMQRHHVHLSPDAPTARVVGTRRGKPIILRIASGRMHRDGHVFYLTANGVWLTEHVPPDYIDFPLA